MTHACTGFLRSNPRRFYVRVFDSDEDRQLQRSRERFVLLSGNDYGDSEAMQNFQRRSWSKPLDAKKKKNPNSPTRFWPRNSPDSSRLVPPAKHAF